MYNVHTHVHVHVCLLYTYFLCTIHVHVHVHVAFAYTRPIMLSALHKYYIVCPTFIVRVRQQFSFERLLPWDLICISNCLSQVSEYLSCIHVYTCVCTCTVQICVQYLYMYMCIYMYMYIQCSSCKAYT